MGSIGGSCIAMVGDLAQGCTRSLAYLLSKFQNIRIYFVAPPLLKMKEDIPGHLRERNSWYAEATKLDQVSAKVNVVYQMWIQKERFAHRIVK
jgi:aspartate carbamoyltransferase catalytic subunit